MNTTFFADTLSPRILSRILILVLPFLARIGTPGYCEPTVHIITALIRLRGLLAIVTFACFFPLRRERRRYPTSHFLFLFIIELNALSSLTSLNITY